MAPSPPHRGLPRVACPARGAARAAAALSLRTATEGATTRITIEGTVPMAYAVSRPFERALLVGGNLDVFTAPGAGTTIELTMGVT